ncbi:MAG: hypothetical protein JWM88_2916 [Verrucomicrobia bacterium]|nr:hypothetical protein [Verrucomicrobiota bacterium]
MKKTVIGIIFGLAVGALAMKLISEHNAAPPKEAAAAAEPPAPNPTKFSAAKREAAGIKLARPTSATLAPEIKGFGRVLDASPFLSLLAEAQSAAATYEGTQKELERVKKLNAADANVSTQAVEAAEAAEARDRAALASARMRMNASWGRQLAGAAGTAITEALEKGGSLVRLDILPGDAPAAMPKNATVALMGSEEVFPAEILGSAPTADPQMQGTSYVALVRDHLLPAGAALRVTVAGAGESKAALIVPRSAIVYHQGSAWVYALGEEDTFFRRLVTLGRSTADGVEIPSGLTEEEQVAVTGAQQLLSAELQAGGAAEEE